MADLSLKQNMYFKLEYIMKSIGNWKRLIILSELSKYENGRSYTELKKAVDALNPDKTKDIRIDFHLEDLRNNNFLKKYDKHSLFQKSSPKVYKLTQSGRAVQSFIISLLETRFYSMISNNGLKFQDQVIFSQNLNFRSLTLMLDISPDFERIQTPDTIYLYGIISDNIQRFPPLINLTITFRFTKTSDSGLKLNIIAYWSTQAIKLAEKKFNIPLINSIDKFIGNSKLTSGLIFIIQQALSKVRDIIYEIDALSAKAISDKIFEYLDSSEHIRSKLSFSDSKSNQK